MKKLIYVFSTVAYFLTSCSNNETTAETPSIDPNSVLLKKEIITDASGTETINYTYNGNKIVKSVTSGGDSTVYIYTGNLITNMKDYSGSDLVRSVDFFYFPNGDLSSFINYTYPTSNIATPFSKKEFFYSNNGEINVKIYSANSTGQLVFQRNGKIIKTNGEISRYEEYQSSSPNLLSRAENYTYDSKNYKFKNVTGFSVISFFRTHNYSNLSNILKVFQEVSGNTSELESNSYTYNSLNFPITHSYTNNGLGASSSQFFYE